MPTRPLRYLHRGEIVERTDLPPTRTLLDHLREDRGCTGTKEGCGEGDCGACTVVLGELEGSEGQERLRLRAVNSCIRLAPSIDGCALWTVEDLRQADGTLHPVQQAMVDHHASQCGFCTPGFVMSMFALYHAQVATPQPEPVTRAAAQEALSGNLCRCTGYRPILDAAQHLADYPLQPLDAAALVEQLRNLRAMSSTPRTDHDRQADGAPQTGHGTPAIAGRAWRPATRAALLAARRDHPQAQIIAGCTDVGLWVTKQHRRFDETLDVTAAQDLQHLTRTDAALQIGAAVRLEDAYAALCADRPALHAFAARFAGRPVRQSGTLGGNIANGSPIGDSMPLLIALGATLQLERMDGEGVIHARAVALEDFYTGYRRTLLAPDELLTRIDVPLPTPQEFARVYKISKRFDDDISAVCLAIALWLDGDRVRDIRIGAGGMAATPVRARATEAALRGGVWDEARVRPAMQALRDEFQPIGDMRASAAYRRTVAGNLLWRFWLERQGVQGVNLETLPVGITV